MNLDLSRTKPHDRGTLAYQPTEISIDTSQLSKYVSFPTPPDTANTREMQLPAVGRFRNDQTQASNVNHGRRRFCDSPKTTSDHDMPQLVLQQPQDLSARRPSNSHLFDSTETAAKFENISARRPRSLSFDQTSVGDTSAASISSNTIPITREQAPILTSNYKYGMTVSGEQERDLDNDTYYVTPQHSSQSPAPTSYFPPYTFPPPPPSVNRSFDMRLSVGGAPVFDVFPRYPQDGSFTPFQPVQPHSSAQEAYYGPALTLPGIFYPQVPQMPMQYPLTASHPMPVVSMDDVRARLGEMRLSPLSASLYHVHPPPPTMHVGPEQASPGASSGFYRSRRQHAHSLQRERSSPERNQLNIAAIEEGRDMRTTVMVKNIPNRMTDEDLERFIAQVCARRIDFMYLRMDFKNGRLLVWLEPWWNVDRLFL